MRRLLIFLAALASVLSGALMAQRPTVKPPLVLAAASLQESMTAAADVWARAGHPRPVLSFAASSALARQVAAARAPTCSFPPTRNGWTIWRGGG